jgi:hypothetical protein
VVTAEEKRLPSKYATAEGSDRTNRDAHDDSIDHDRYEQKWPMCWKNYLMQVGGYSECYCLPLYVILNVDGHGADLDCWVSIGTSRPNLSRTACRSDRPG